VELQSILNSFGNVVKTKLKNCLFIWLLLWLWCDFLYHLRCVTSM